MPTSTSDRPRQALTPVCALLAVAAVPDAGAGAVVWTTPCMLSAAMLIAWAAESAQFFMAQGLALAILAWLQTLPEFAVEAVLAWERKVSLLTAGLTGALRLLTGLGWPMIYFTAALFHRRRYRRPLGSIRLEDEHCVEVMGLLPPMAYAAIVWAKGSLNVIDAAILILMYVAYLAVLRRMPPKAEESIEDLELIPRTVVTAPRNTRVAAIAGLFVVGGGLIYFVAEPFLDSLQALAVNLGIPTFIFIQWVAPFVSEFPEKVSAFYWARTVKGSPTALMNMVSSNINQWTLLAAMLPITYSISIGAVTAIPFDAEQRLEVLMTLGQALLGAIFLIDMKLVWWEAAGLFALWFIQFALSPIKPGPTGIGFLAAHIHRWVTAAYFVWAAVEVGRMAAGKRQPAAFRLFGLMWKRHVRA
ncbi:MAG: hypothetical protein LAQ30_13750 [Acidobacteriia bacterium]|nr:hypothetical protein [Terriglobia bacterium]